MPNAREFLDAPEPAVETRGLPTARRSAASFLDSPDFTNVQMTFTSTENAGGAPDYSSAFADPGNQLKTQNPVLGLVQRANDLVGSGLRGLANIAEPLGDKLETAIPLSGLTPEQIKDENQLQALYDIADWFSGKVIDYTPTRSLDQVKAIVDPNAPESLMERAGNFGAFAGERVVTSIPDMVASVGALPAYILGRTNEIATTRVANDGRTEQPTLGDMATALPAATGEALLERFATKLLPGLGRAPGATAPGRIAAQTGIQAGTEAAEEGIANLGESLGTKRGVVGQEFADAILEGGIVGGSMGGGTQSVSEGVNAATRPRIAELPTEGVSIADLIASMPPPILPAVAAEGAASPRQGDAPAAPPTQPVDTDLDALLLRNALLGESSPAASATPSVAEAAATPFAVQPPPAAVPPPPFRREYIDTGRKDKKGLPIRRPKLDLSHDGLLQWLGASGGVNLDELVREAGADPKLTTDRETMQPFGRPGMPAVRRNGGMTLDRLREAMQEQGWLPQDDPNSPNTIGNNDALDLVMEALSGRPVYHPTEGVDGRAQRAMDEEAYWWETNGGAILEPDPAEIDTPEQYEAAYADDVSAASDVVGRELPPEDEDGALGLAELAQRAREAGVDPVEIEWAAADTPAETARNLWRLIERPEAYGAEPRRDAETTGRGSERQPENVPAQEGGEPAGFRLERQEAPRQETGAVGRGQGGLFAPPTTREMVAARERDADAERNGLGRDLVPASRGAGELFAGGRPDQARIDEPAPQRVTGIKNAATNTERVAEGRDPIIRAAALESKAALSAMAGVRSPQRSLPDTPYNAGLQQRKKQAAQMRAEGGSLVDYGADEQRYWLRGQSLSSNGKLKLYRAVRPGGSIEPGDYVTNSRSYAAQHLRDNLGGEGEILSVDGWADELFPADGPGEFWYAPRSLDETSHQRSKGAGRGESGQARDALTERLGRGVVARLERAGVLVLDDRNGGTWDGTRIGIGNVAPENALGVLLHEVTHANMLDVLGEQGYERALRDLDALEAAGDPLALKAKRRAAKSGETGQRLDDERIAYMVEEATNAATPAPKVTEFVRSLFSAFRRWAVTSAVFRALEKIGVDRPTLKPADFAAFARKGLDRMVAQARKPVGTDGADRIRELETALRTDYKTGIRNQRAFDEDENLGWKGVASMDMDGLKMLNDQVSHGAGDAVLKALANELARAETSGVRFYRLSGAGDEFAGRFKTQADADRVMAEIQSSLDGLEVELDVTGKDGQTRYYTYQGIGLSYGTGDNYDAADDALNQQKADRLAAGVREAPRADGPSRRIRESAPREGGRRQGDPPSVGAQRSIPESEDAAPADADPVAARPGKFSAAQEAAMAKAGMPTDRRTTLTKAADKLRAAWETAREAMGTPDTRRQSVADRFHGLRAAEAQIGGLAPEESPYIAARLTTGLPSIMESLMTFGAPKWDGGALTIDTNTVGLLDALKPVSKDIDAWLGWMVGRRAKLLKSQGRENLFTDGDIDALLALADGKEAEFTAAAKAYLRIKNNVLDVAEQAGLIDPAQRAAWDHAEYVPFYRQEGDQAIGPGTRKGLEGQTSGIRTLRGGESDLSDPLANIVRNFTRLIDSSLKNRAMLLSVDKLGKTMFTKKGADFEPVMIPMDQVKRTLKEQGVSDATIASMPAGALKGVQRMFSIKPPEADNVVRVMRDGKAEYYEVSDPVVLRALTAFTVRDPGMARKVLMFAKRLLTVGVTTTPEFVIANFIRDTGSTWIIGDKKIKLGIDAATGTVRTLMKDEATREMMAGGGSFIGGNVYAGDVDATAKALRRALRGGMFGKLKKSMSEGDITEFSKTVAYSPFVLWDKWMVLSSAIENANRNAVYRAALAAGKPRIQAIYEAKDLMDFSMRGDSELMGFFADVLPFFNARVQGLYKLGRAGADPATRNQILVRGSMLALASVALWAWNTAMYADGYDELEEWDKDTYWHIAPGTSRHIRIPKPFEIGLLFGTGPERMAQAIVHQVPGGKEGDRPAQSWGALFRAITGTLAVNPIPQAAMPVAEQWANKRFFTGRPIENMSDEKLLPEAREEWYTSDTMKAVAQFAGNETGMGAKRLEHLWNGYTGGLGMYLMDASDLAVRQATDAPSRPEMAPTDFPLIGRFYRGDDEPKNTRYVTEFYDLRKKAQEVSGTIKTYLDEGDTERAEKLERKYEWLLGPRVESKRAKGGVMFETVREIELLAKDLSERRAATEEIVKSDASPAKKREAINDELRSRNSQTKHMVQRLRGSQDAYRSTDKKP